MRLILIFLVAITCTPSFAATIIKGTLDPDDAGFVSIDSFSLGTVGPQIPDNSRVKVSLKINRGVIAEVQTYAFILYVYDAYSKEYPGNLYPDAGLGNDFHWSEACEYNSYGPDGCHYAAHFPDESYAPSMFLTDLKVKSKSLSYEVFRPHSYNNCDHIFVGRCSEFWDISNSDFQFRVASRKPVSYTLTYGEPVGVPEPASWALMIAGFGLAGGALRKQRKQANHQHVSFT